MNHLRAHLWKNMPRPQPQMSGGRAQASQLTLPRSVRSPILSSQQLYQFISLFNQQPFQIEILSCRVEKGRKGNEIQNNTEVPASQKAEDQGTVPAHTTQRSEPSHEHDHIHPDIYKNFYRDSFSNQKVASERSLIPSFPLYENSNC